nr:PatB family C-S lyase [Acidaminobacter sp. JC074]
MLNRANFNAEKWSNTRQKKLFKKDHLHPMWIADMEFMTVPQTIIDIKKRALEGHFGYEYKSEDFFDSFIEWQKKIHNWHIDKSWIHTAPSVSSALPILIEILTEKEDGIIIQPPVYHNFASTVKSMGRKLYKSPLKLTFEFEMDFDSLEELMEKDHTKVIIISNPHNPVGRVWREDELRKLSILALKHGVRVISDEIHRDIILTGHKMVNMMTLGDDISNNTITLLSPGKTFNLSGQSIATAIITNPIISKNFNDFIHMFHLNHNNILSNTAFESAYKHGEDWYNQMIKQVEGNLKTLKEYISFKLPEIQLIEPEGTYLVWLDMRKLQPDPHLLLDALSEAGLAVDAGHWYGREGAGFIRLNLACPESHLHKAISLLKSAVESLRVPSN